MRNTKSTKYSISNLVVPKQKWFYKQIQYFIHPMKAFPSPQKQLYSRCKCPPASSNMHLIWILLYHKCTTQKRPSKAITITMHSYCPSGFYDNSTGWWWSLLRWGTAKTFPQQHLVLARQSLAFFMPSIKIKMCKINRSECSSSFWPKPWVYVII